MTTRRAFGWAALASSLSIGLGLAGCSRETPAPAAPPSPSPAGAPGAPGAPGGTGTTGTATETVRYAGYPGVTGLGVQLGIETGIFAQEGLSLEFVDTRDPVPALAAGDIDAADWNTTGAIIAAGKGVPISIVASMFRHVGPFYLVGRPEIGSVAELSGKAVGSAAFGTGLDVYARTILARQGVDLKTVDFVANGVNGAALATLENRSVAATIIHEPFASLAEATGKGKVLAAGYDFLPRFHTGVIVAANGFIDAQPERLRRFLRAYHRSNVYARTHLDEYKAFYAQRLKVEPSVVEAAVQRELPIWANDPEVSLDELRETQEVQLALGFQKEIYDASKFVRTGFTPSRTAP